MGGHCTGIARPNGDLAEHIMNGHCVGAYDNALGGVRREAFAS